MISTLGLKVACIFLTKTTDILAYSFSTEAFRALMLGWEKK